MMPVTARASWAVLALAAVALCACTAGQIGDPGAPTGGQPSGPGAAPGGGAAGGGSAGGPLPTPAQCDNAAPTAATNPLRRLEPAAITRGIGELLGDPALKLDLDADTGTVISELAVAKLNAAVFTLAENDAHLARFATCSVSGQGSDACADGFIAKLAGAAFRRPPTSAETAWLKGIYAKVEAANGFSDALRVVFAVVLQSPQFLYVLERGVAAPVAGAPAGVVELSGYERATRLALFLWQAPPDDALLLSAKTGELDSAAGMQKAARRLMHDPRGRAAVVRLLLHWLEIDGTAIHHSLDSAVKDAKRYPEDSPALRAAMRTELAKLVERAVFDDDGTVDTLLNTRWAYVSPALAKLYGLSSPAAGEASKWVQLPQSQRAGLLTRAGFLALYAGPQVQSPIRRGAFILEKALCVHLGEPPPNASDTPVTGGAVNNGGTVTLRTVREDVIAKTTGGVCQGCHRTVNPVGFAFENYDALGRWQTAETGVDGNGKAFSLPIDASGALPLADKDGVYAGALDKVNGAIEMSAKLAKSDLFRRCFARTVMTRALSRAPAAAEQCSLVKAQQRFIQSGSVEDLVLAVVTSDAFLYVNTNAK